MTTDVELQDIDQIELSLTGLPAVKEDFIMVKSDDKDKEVKEKKEQEAKERFAKFSELDEDARLAAFMAMEKAVHDDEEEDEDEDEEDDEKKDKKNKKGPPNFNFDKADEPTKIALRAIGEAISNLPDLPTPVAEFAKSIKEKLPVNGTPKSAELIAFAKSNMPGLVEAIQEPLTKQLGEVTKNVEELQADKDLEAMKLIAAELPGEVDIVAKRLIGFKKSMSEADFTAYIEEQKGLKAQVAKSEVFSRSSNGQPVTGSAEAIIMSKAQGMVAKSEHGVKTMVEAIEFVGQNDPVLWNQYQEEIRNKSVRGQAA